ncbi:LuxR family transcriptional regulator [Pseudonocardia zijingensis]|uniref:LuxR family transcriptional regulator n=2 Tax=Pseudonocardia zijingensis TaxID=153376 RepID=A0ABP3YYG2_9PSEU
MEFAFAALNQVCAPVLDHLAHLPAPQRAALGTAFGLRIGSPPDRFMVGLAVLGLFAEVAREQPLVCVVDDAQWLDTASAQVLGFVARRLRAESIGMIFAVRDAGDEHAVPELVGLPEMHVPGLPDHDARTLVVSAHPGPVDAQVLDRVIAESRGNPLALLELPRGFTPVEIGSGFGRFGPAALPDRIAESFRRQFSTLSPMTQRVLLIAAAEPVGDPVLVWRASDRAGIGLDTDRAAREASAELVEFGSRVRFRHPLLRSAIYEAAAPEARRQAHRALAEVTDPATDPDRRAWHRAQATAGTDEDVAAELEQCADRSQARGGPAAAAAFFERAADLTPDAGRRGKRLLAAAFAEHVAGMADAALRLLALAEASPLSALERAQADRLRARVAFTVKHGREAPALLLKAAVRLEALDVRLARETYMEALQAAWFAAHLATGPDVHDLSAAARAALAPDGSQSSSDLLLQGLVVRYTDGYPAGAPLLKRALEVVLDEDPSADIGLRWHWFASITSMDLWEYAAFDALTSRFVETARASGALAPLPMALTHRALLKVFSGDLASAGGLLEEFEAARDGMGVHDMPYAALLLAVWRGQEQQAAALVETATAEATRRGEGTGMIAASWAEALLCNSLGRFQQALSAARRATEPHQEMGLMTWCSLVELVTAAAGAGQVDAAVDALARLSGIARASGTDWALGLRARCRAMVSDAGAAESHYREAVERLGRTHIRGELARTHLHYGIWLRRQGRRGDAREELQTAHAMFTGMDMRAFAVLAARELSTIGESARARAQSGSGQLTVQEAQVVRLVRDGLSNAEIAARLFISPRTVEWHLSKIFSKLGVTSRRQL